MSTSGAQGFQIRNWRPRESGSLRGFFSVVMPSGLIVNDCQLLEKADRRWINLPSRQYEVRGERKFAPVVEFTDRDAEDRFCGQALNALERLLAEANR